MKGLLVIALAGCGRLGFENADPTFDASPSDADRSYRGMILADTPVGYWRLGEATAGVARDEVGVNDGTYVGACEFSAPGALSSDADTAVRFGAASIGPRCMVTFGTRFDFTARSPFSIEAWVAPSAAPFGHVFSRQIREAAPIKGYALLQSPNGMYVERAVDGINLTTNRASATLDAFSHVVAVYDGLEMRIYTDGVLAATPEADPRDAVPFDATAMIGCSVANTNCFEGVIDEVALYDKVLPDSTIAAHAARAF